MSNRPGHNKVKCTRYKSEGRREKNKLRKLKRVLKLQPNNKQVANQVNSLNKQ